MRQRLYAGLAAVLAAFAFTAIPAHAGSNGQELEYDVRCYANYTETSGYNQNGQYVDSWYYTPAADPYNYCSQPVYQHWSWWWVGWVTVQRWWGYDGGRGDNNRGAKDFYVPQSQEYDWTEVQVPSD